MSLLVNGRATRALRPVTTAPETLSKSGSLLVGACDWPSHQHVWACYRMPTNPHEFGGGETPNVAYEDILKEFDNVWCVNGLNVMRNSLLVA